MEVQDIYIYPVKSLGGIRVSSAEILQKGFRFDRRFMLIDAENRFISQRSEAALARLHTAIEDEQVIVFPADDPQNRLLVSDLSQAGETLPVTVWDDTAEAVFTGKNHADWFSAYLGKPVRLVHFPEKNPRPVDPRYAENAEHVSLADGFPYLLIGQQSLNDLNGRLGEPVPMDRFRPNIVVSGAPPFGEDEWQEIFIGETRFQVAKPCARCVLITIDQRSGEKGKEPLATLSRYRRSGKKVLFGQNLIALQGGTIRTGDAVQVIRVKNPPEMSTAAPGSG